MIAAVLGLAGTAVGVLLTQRLYRSETVLLYEKGLVGGGEESSRGLGIRLQDAFSSRVRLEGLIKKNKLYPGMVKKRGLVEAAEEMNTHIKVLLREGFAYRISYDTDDCDRAQDVLTQLVIPSSMRRTKGGAGKPTRPRAFSTPNGHVLTRM